MARCDRYLSLLAVMRVELVIRETDADSTVGTTYDRDANRGLRFLTRLVDRRSRASSKSKGLLYRSSAMTTYIKAAKTSEIPANSGKALSVNGKAIAVFNVDGAFYAIDNTCLHRGGPLGDGSRSVLGVGIRGW